MVAWKPMFMGESGGYEHKTIDLYAHGVLKVGPMGLGRICSRNKLEMEAKGWELVKEENGIALFRRRI